MRIDVFSVCRRPPSWARDLTSQYAERCRPGLEVRFDCVAPGPSSKSSAERCADEAARLTRRFSNKAPMLALDEAGIQMNSRKFAATLDRLRQDYDQITVVIGGADGLDQTLRDSAFAAWSLSAMTLPHLLVQVVLAEQLYRAWTIINGHPYHRD
ncbi:MAG: 23S rRNA (pseudouridine(1915)-N(3))-methyltransferase RlmH [Gammaproteobacteria bacterium]